VADSLAIRVKVDASDFLDKEIFDTIEETILEIYLRKFRSRGSGVAWTWYIEVNAASIVPGVFAGRRLVEDAVDRFIKRQMRKDLGALQSLLMSHGREGMTEVGVKIPALSPGYLRTPEKKSTPWFFEKTGEAGKEVFSTEIISIPSQGGIFEYRWASDNERWKQFNKEPPANNQPERPVIDILRIYFKENLENLAGFIDSADYASYEDVARLINSRV